jgi:CheY-like chemotaxis protein
MRHFVDRRVKELLFASADDQLRASVVEIVGNSDVHTTVAASARDVEQGLARQRYDCLVVDANLPGASGVELVESLVADPARAAVPLVVYTSAGLAEPLQRRLETLASRGAIRAVGSLEELFDVTALFLHRVASALPENRRTLLERLSPADRSLTGRTVLIVDDDVRNIFAMTSLLERHGMKVVSAETGREALSALHGASLDLVLMDIMLPEMDGYETMRAIRLQDAFRDLPIIALTAKAMKGDRERCIEAGASDYLAKPVDTERLLATVRLWLTH